MAESYYVKFPEVCKHLGIDASKVCGPVMMAAGWDPEACCPFGHPRGSPLHKPPVVKGQPFKLKDHKDELEKLGLTTQKQELAAMVAAGDKPSGTPRKIGKTLVYPKPHFG